MQTPFKTEGMTTEELIAYHGDSAASVECVLHTDKAPTLKLAIQQGAFAWHGEFFYAGDTWYLVSAQCSANELLSRNAFQVKRILEQVRKALS
jgi:hypothetical protein